MTSGNGFSGSPEYTRFGGWFAARPHTPDEPLQYALQSFPMLVKPGGILGYPDEDGRPARRTVIGMDGDLDAVAVSGHGFINGVVHHLVDQVVQTAYPDIAYIHGWAHPNMCNSFKRLNAVRGIILVFQFFVHTCLRLYLHEIFQSYKYTKNPF